MLIFDFLGIGSGIQKLLISLVNGFYHLATFFFKIFIILSEGELINREDYGVLLSNIYVILGIVMLFVLAFTLLKSMINPDDQQQGTTVIKKVVINVVTSAIMLALLPTIFSFAFDFQHSILSQNTLGRLFGIGGTGSAESTVENKANMITNSVYTAFFNVSQTKDGKCVAEDSISITTDTTLSDCQKEIKGDNNVGDFKKIINYVGRTGRFGVYKQFSESVHKEKIDFDFLMSLIAGACLCYVALSYALDMGVRMVKLVFYQMIAPIPIMFRIIPYGKLSGVFNDWVKVTLSCFLEVFIRLFALYFCVYLCSAISDSKFLQFSNFAEHGVMAWLFTKALIFIGIVTFMKSAPQLIGQITGIDSGNMKLGIKEKLAAGGAFAAGAVIGGGVTGMVRNAVNAGGNIKNKWGESKGFKGKAGLIAGALGSTIAGATSGAYHSGKAGINAKGFGDVKNASNKGADISSDRRDQRKADKEAHGGFLGNVAYQAKKKVQGVGEHFGFGADITQLQKQQQIYQEGMQIKSELFDIVKDEAEVQAYKGLLLNAQERDVKEYAEDLRLNKNGEVYNKKTGQVMTGYTDIQAAAIALKTQEIDKCDKAYKIVQEKAVQQKIKDGDSRVKAVLQQVDTFKKQYANNEVVNQISVEAWNDEIWDDVNKALASNNLDKISNAKKTLEETQGSILATDKKFKQANSEIKIEINKRVQEKNKDNK